MHRNIDATTPDTHILCLDTSTDFATFALGTRSGGLVAGLSLRHDRSLSTRLYPMLEGVLRAAGTRFGDVDALAVGIGPGSFTGVRVAVTTMRTLAQVSGKPLVAVGTLDILAKSASAGESPMCVLLPSRRDEVYAAVYESGIRRTEPFTASYSRIRQMDDLLGAAPVFAGPSSLLELVFPDQDRAQLAAALQVVDAPLPSALAALAAQELRAGRYEDPMALDPLYIAPPAISQHKSVAANAPAPPDSPAQLTG